MASSRGNEITRQAMSSFFTFHEWEPIATRDEIICFKKSRRFETFLSRRPIARSQFLGLTSISFISKERR